MIKYFLNKPEGDYEVVDFDEFFNQQLRDNSIEIALRGFQDILEDDYNMNRLLLRTIEYIEIYGYVPDEALLEVLEKCDLVVVDDSISYCDKCGNAVAMYYNKDDYLEYKYNRLCKHCLYELSEIEKDSTLFSSSILNNNLSLDIRLLTSRMMMEYLSGYVLAPNGGMRLVYNEQNQIIEDPNYIPYICIDNKQLESILNKP